MATQKGDSATPKQPSISGPGFRLSSKSKTMISLITDTNARNQFKRMMIDAEANSVKSEKRSK